MLVEILGKILAWILTLIYFMVIVPIGVVLQGLWTPIGIIIYCIIEKRFISCTELWKIYTGFISDGFKMLHDYAVELDD